MAPSSGTEGDSSARLARWAVTSPSTSSTTCTRKSRLAPVDAAAAPLLSAMPSAGMPPSSSWPPPVRKAAGPHRGGSAISERSRPATIAVSRRDRARVHRGWSTHAAWASAVPGSVTGTSTAGQ
ncbi:hypothetical protein [Prauserella shujinwangii]|uniref:hypothetical protein n=1 Tax=Prauserella shujinwangii TaxID=1453103 RepID=UPI001FEAF1C9|nr:hypothetical protein [Prauserella shujinwangii]